MQNCENVIQEWEDDINFSFLNHIFTILNYIFNFLLIIQESLFSKSSWHDSTKKETLL